MRKWLNRIAAWEAKVFRRISLLRRVKTAPTQFCHFISKGDSKTLPDFQISRLVNLNSVKEKHRVQFTVKKIPKFSI